MKTVTNKETGEVVEWTDEAFIAERDRLLQAWEAAKLALDAAKETEMIMRKEVVDFAFDPEKTKGTERIELGAGYQAKAVKKLNFGFVKNSEDKIDKAAIDKALSKIEKDGDAGKMIAERLVKWDPSLSQTEYKLLSDKHKAIIDAVIVTTEGAPTLEIIAPKSAR